jgi:hypothetical protein
MSSKSTIGNKPIKYIYIGDQQNKYKKIQQVLLGRANNTTKLVYQACEHLKWGKVKYDWEDAEIINNANTGYSNCTSYRTGVATATCSNCGKTLTEKVSTEKVTSGGYWCDEPFRYQNKATFTQLANATKYYTIRTGSAGNKHWGGSAATCTTAQICQGCGTTRVAALGHSYGETTVVSEARCNRSKQCQQVCSTCGYVWTFGAGGPVLDNHDYHESEIKSASCTEDGYILYKCGWCGNSYKKTYAAWGHEEKVISIQTFPYGLSYRSYATVQCQTCGATRGYWI